MTDGDALVAFVRASAALEPALVAWITPLLVAGLSKSRRRKVRDALLRQAGLALPGMSAWGRSRTLALMMRRRARPDTSTAEGLASLAVAIHSGRRPLSVAQIFRIVSRKPPVEMRTDGVLDSNSMLEVVLQMKGEQS